MSGAIRVIHRCPQSRVVVVTIVAIGLLVLAAARLSADGGSPGPLAQSCGVPPAAASGGQAGSGLLQFPPVNIPSNYRLSRCLARAMTSPILIAPA